MSRTIVARWQNWAAAGLEHLVLRETSAEINVESAIVGPPGPEAFAAQYRILCDRAWRVRHLEVSLLGDPRRLALSSDGVGHWADHAGMSRPELAGAVDVDLSATPFTNTLPIRRLGLGRGQSAAIAVVYVGVPELTVAIDRQRYTCREPGRRYRYESLDSDFTREIDVDSDGLVVTYPGLFRRVL